MMIDISKLKEELALEFSSELRKMSEQELLKLHRNVFEFLALYIDAYELDRKIYLVLDNSIVQDFKHIIHKKRRINAMAFCIYCRFVARWSDRPTCLAISPVVVYEHGGRRPTISAQEALERAGEIHKFLKYCGMPIAWIRFEDGESLHQELLNVHADADFLGVFASQIKEADWERDLRAYHGGEILAATFADKAIPTDMPLKYFDPFYVREVFRSRIEEKIANESEGVFSSQPIRTGKVSAALAKLNTLNKNGILKGLGDIDLFQICDVGRQYVQSTDYVMLGMSVDGGLNEVLSYHHRLVQSRQVVGGSKDVEKQISEAIHFIFSEPFAKEQALCSRISPLADEFLGYLWELCRNALESA